MMTAISIENVSKYYRLGSIGSRTLSDDLKRWWARLRGQPDPLLKIGETYYGNQEGEYIWALRDVSMQVQQGEILGIIGRNGAGKSTLLKILSRVTAPTSGVVRIRGRIASLLEVGTGFHPELTGRENIFLNGAVLGMSRSEIQRKFDEIVAFSEVERFIDTPVKRYSSGMYVRLAFAVAAHLDPEILVVDEVLAVGDAAFQKKCLGRMSDVAGEGRTVLFVSHNMSAINRLCTRVILLESGRITATGTASEVTARYLRGTENEKSVRAWNLNEAPGTDELRLISVKLLKNGDTPASVFEVGDEISVQFEYYVGRPRLSFRIAALFYSQGVLAFASVEPTESERPSAGKYYSTVTIPPHLLAEQEYVVGVSIFSSAGTKIHYLRITDALTFQVYDSMKGSSARGDYAQNLGGLVRPLLNWNSGLIE